MAAVICAWLGSLSPRRVLHLLLSATALYFFSGWFGGLQANPTPQAEPFLVAVWRTDLKKTVMMDLEEYIKGVVAAEMPVSFHPEALKAQAVAARTYALYTLKTRSGVPGYPDAALITDHRIDQAWISQAEFRKRYGFLEYYWRWRRISQAVEETRGQVLTYQGNLILAVYHSCSGGVTENSENYWVSALPYLRSVPDPAPPSSPYVSTQIEFTKTKVLDSLLKLPATGAAPALARTGSSGSAIEVLERYESGRVRTIRIGERQYTGRQVREALGLRSNWFDVIENNNKITFVVHGNGHGVGMSQYGADTYAKQGARYDQILKHYYSGVELTTML